MILMAARQTSSTTAEKFNLRVALSAGRPIARMVAAARSNRLPVEWRLPRRCVQTPKVGCDAI